jgi:hypothetical protein
MGVVRRNRFKSVSRRIFYFGVPRQTMARIHGETTMTLPALYTTPPAAQPAPATDTEQINSGCWYKTDLTAAQPAPVPCCGQYETCTQACTPRGEFLAKREAQTAQPAPVQPVSGVVLRDGYPTLIQDKHIKETDQRLCILPTTPPGAPKKGQP